MLQRYGGVSWNLEVSCIISIGGRETSAASTCQDLFGSGGKQFSLHLKVSMSFDKGMRGKLKWEGEDIGWGEQRQDGKNRAPLVWGKGDGVGVCRG